jgi:hypothetical protein
MPQGNHNRSIEWDQKRDLTLAVTVALNWVSGEPIFLELTDYVDDNEMRKNGSLPA